MTTQEDLNIELYLRTMTQSSVFGYWNALLTMNAIFISIFSAIALFQSERIIFIYLLILTSLISSALIIANYRQQVEFYRDLGQLQRQSLSQEEIVEYKVQAASGHEKIKTREYIITGIMIAQGLLLIILLILRYNSIPR